MLAIEIINHVLLIIEPDVVKNLTAGNITTNSISLSWETPYGNASSFEIQILGEPSSNRTVKTTFDTIDGLIPGNLYILLVSAVVGENNITGNSSQLLVYTSKYFLYSHCQYTTICVFKGREPTMNQQS